MVSLFFHSIITIKMSVQVFTRACVKQSQGDYFKEMEHQSFFLHYACFLPNPSVTTYLEVISLLHMQSRSHDSDSSTKKTIIFMRYVGVLHSPKIVQISPEPVLLLLFVEI